MAGVRGRALRGVAAGGWQEHRPAGPGAGPPQPHPQLHPLPVGTRPRTGAGTPGDMGMGPPRDGTPWGMDRTGPPGSGTCWDPLGWDPTSNTGTALGSPDPHVGLGQEPCMAGTGSSVTTMVPRLGQEHPRLCWGEMPWSRTHLVMVQDPSGHWDPTEWDKALCLPKKRL